MKAIILAAGMGTRLGKYTENLPKGMLNFDGKTLIERHISNLKSLGINEIIVITGYKKDKINYNNVKYYYNEKYDSTNMVESLMCAKCELNTDVIVLYSDILCSLQVLKNAIENQNDIGVVVDSNWRNYWILKYGTTEEDLESLKISNGNITELGKPLISSDGVDYRYVGIIKFSKNGIQNTIQVYDGKKEKNENWIQSGKSFEKGYMTDLLNEVILNKYTVNPIIIKGGWIEFDTNKDYELYIEMLKNRTLGSLL